MPALMVSDTNPDLNIPEVKLFARFCQTKEDDPLPIGKASYLMLQVFPHLAVLLTV